MSFFGDAFAFDKFALKDIWGQLKDNPERAFIGAIDPASSKMWSEITGKEYEPLVDQMGGPYGGGWVSAFGKDQDGGVYGRAKAAGIDTKAGGQMHDAAHVVSAIFGGKGLMGLGSGGAGGSSGGSSLFGGQGSAPQLGNSWMQNFWGSQGQSIPGIAGNTSTGTGIYGGFGGIGQGSQGGLMSQMGGMQGMGQLQGMMGGQQQQEPEGPKPYWYRGQVVWM